MGRKNKKNYMPVSEEKALKISADIAKFGETMDFLKTLVKAVAACVTIHYLYKILAELSLNLAGKETIANIGVDLSFVWPTLTLGSMCLAYGERKNKGTQIKRLSKENKELKRRIDSGVGTSSLRDDGETRMEDRL